MRITARQTLAVTVLLALVAGLLAACTMSRDVTAKGRSAEVSPAGSTTLTVPEGPIVILPKGAVTDSGKVTVTAATQGKLSGWSIKLSGAKLRGKVTLSFPEPKDASGAPAVAAYSEPPSTEVHLVDGKVKNGRLIVSVDHFSNWWPDPLGYLHDELLGAIIDTFGTVNVEQPSCSSFAELSAAGWGYTSTKTRTALECIGANSDGSAPQIKLANRLGIPLQVQITKGMKIDPGDSTLEEALGKLLTEASEDPFAPSATSHFIGSGETAVVTASAGKDGGVLAQPSGIAILASVLDTAVQELLLVGKWSGETRSEKAVMEGLENQQCMQGLASQSLKRSIKTGADAIDYLVSLIQPVFDCASQFIEKEGMTGLLGAKLVGIVEWLGSISLNAAQIGTAALVSLYEPRGDEIDVFAPKTPSQPECPTGYDLVELAYNVGGYFLLCDKHGDKGLSVPSAQGDRGFHVDVQIIVSEPGIHEVFAIGALETGQGQLRVSNEKGDSAAIDSSTTASDPPQNFINFASGGGKGWVVTKRVLGDAAG